jgi:hypothetical protein
VTANTNPVVQQPPAPQSLTVAATSADAAEQPQPLLLQATVDANGGQFVGGRLAFGVPPNVVGAAGAELSVLLVDPAAVPVPASGFALGTTAFLITLTDSNTGGHLTQLTSPLTLEYQLNETELSQAGGDPNRLTIASWSENTWVALSCSATTRRLSCSVPHLSLFAPIVAPPLTGRSDVPMPNGWFYKQANGFGGAGEVGFGVVDDTEASLWTEFQRLGGVDQLGYPISSRFQYDGFITQAFQKLTLQWRPELGEAVPLNVLDDLNGQRRDAWLDNQRQVPQPEDTIADAGLDFESIKARHLALLDVDPALAAFWQAAPDALTMYGLPLSVKDYGAFTTVRLQRATWQLWHSGSNEPRVVLGNAGDLAKEAGLWPMPALVPGPPPTVAVVEQGAP